MKGDGLKKTKKYVSYLFTILLKERKSRIDKNGETFFVQIDKIDIDN